MQSFRLLIDWKLQEVQKMKLGSQIRKFRNELSLSQDEFLSRMKNVFGDLYDFSQSEYISLFTKVKCT